MSSDPFLLDGLLLHHSHDLELQDLSDSLFSDPPPFDIFEALENYPEPYTKQPTDVLNSVSLSTSPSSLKMHSLSLTACDSEKQAAIPLMVSSGNSSACLDFQVCLSPLAPRVVKQETLNAPPFLDKMQRSFSSHSLESAEMPLKAGLFHHHLSSLSQAVESGFSAGTMRRVFSTGDLPQINRMQTNQRAASPLEMCSRSFDESGFKVGRYNDEQRKQSIHRYRSKRTQRNFNKKIKYACRKTLADSRLRVRGRFARNDDIVENHKAHDEDEEEVDGGFHGQEGFLMSHKHGAFNPDHHIGCTVSICPSYQYFGF